MPYKTHRVTADDLAIKLRSYQDRYGVPSERLAEAFLVDGRLKETEDFQNWSHTYTAWKLTSQSR